MEVHRVLSPGFGENVYERALYIELDLRRISPALPLLLASWRLGDLSSIERRGPTP